MIQTAPSHMTSIAPWQMNVTPTLPPFQSKRCKHYPPDDGSKAYALARRAQDATCGGDDVEVSTLADLAIEASMAPTAWQVKTWALSIKSFSLTGIGMHAEALDHALHALRLAEAHNDHTLISRASCAIGFVAIEADNLSQAQDVLERGLIHAEISGSLNDLFWALNKLCDVYSVQAKRQLKKTGVRALSRGVVGQLIETATRALEVAKKLETKTAHCRALLNLVNACILNQDTQKAWLLLDECKAIAKGQDDLRLLGLINLDTARLLELEGASEDAISLIADPTHLAHLCITDDLKLRSHAFLARACSAVGKFEQAFCQMSAARDIERNINLARTERQTQHLVASMKMREASINAESLHMKAQTLEMRNSLLTQERDILRRHAMFDPLTGVGNRRAADAAFSAQVDKALKTSEDFFVAYLDIDNFKPVNDHFGHQIGDAVLKQIGQILHDNIRSSDQIFRYGGEEFVLILTGKHIDASLSICEKLRCAIKAHPWQVVAKHLSITASFGLAQWANEPSEAAVMGRADRALYQAKDQGRDRVVFISA